MDAHENGHDGALLLYQLSFSYFWILDDITMSKSLQNGDDSFNERTIHPLHLHPLCLLIIHPLIIPVT